MRSVARKFKVSLLTVQRWVGRAKGRRSDRVDWSDRPRGRHPAINRTAHALEDLILKTRHELKERSDLGEYGAVALRDALDEQDIEGIPSIRTIGRILARRGALDYRRRKPLPAPARGWYLPDVAEGEAELDAFDVIEGLVIQGGPEIQVLTAASLHGRWVGAWPGLALGSQAIAEALASHWRGEGLPSYAQFDNDTRFQGPHQFPDTFGRVTRLCLSLRVVPVFVPPQETGFQAAIENFNGRWQAKVWKRWWHTSLATLCEKSNRYIAASRLKAARACESAPPRRNFPRKWKPDFQAALQGRVIFLRRTSEQGAVSLLGRTFSVDPLWRHRLVRAEVDLDAETICFHGLRRAEPNYQPLLKETRYHVPRKPFLE